MEGTIWQSNVQDLFVSELQLALIKAGSNPLLSTFTDHHDGSAWHRDVQDLFAG